MGDGRRIVAYVSDLLFSSRIEGVLGRGGHRVQVVDDLTALESTLAEGPPDVVLLDLHAGASASAVVARAAPLGVPVLAFGRHTEAALLRDARKAGCAEAVPRSTFVEEMAALVERVAQAGP